MNLSMGHGGARSAWVLTLAILLLASPCHGHGTTSYPKSRVLRVYEANPANPNFALAANAVAIDGSLSYYTWNEVSRNIPQAVQAGLPPGYDYSTWIPDGQLASAGRVDPNSPLYPRTYAGLDQVSAAWPTTPLIGGSTITVRFHATAPHAPSVWDVWMTRPGWDPTQPLRWADMEFLGRPAQVPLVGSEYRFDLTVPSDRSGHHVLWIAWQRDDPAGEVFVSASDVSIRQPFGLDLRTSGAGDLTIDLNGAPLAMAEGFTLFSLDTARPVGTGSFFGLEPDALTLAIATYPAATGSPLHHVAPYAANLYPNVPFLFPPGSLGALSGTTVDGMAVALDASFGFLGVTPVVRIGL